MRSEHGKSWCALGQPEACPHPKARASAGTGVHVLLASLNPLATSSGVSLQRVEKQLLKSPALSSPSLLRR